MAAAFRHEVGGGRSAEGKGGGGSGGGGEEEARAQRHSRSWSADVGLRAGTALRPRSSAFFNFMDGIRTRLPGLSRREVAKRAPAIWLALSPEEKQPYLDLAKFACSLPPVKKRLDSSLPMLGFDEAAGSGGGGRESGDEDGVGGGRRPFRRSARHFTRRSRSPHYHKHVPPPTPATPL